MIVVIAGGHGKIGLALGRRLVAEGTEVRGIIRNPDHAPDLEAVGVMPALCDLEAEAGELAGILSGSDAVVFAAGAGPGSGDARKATMDRDGAVKLIEACRVTGVRRYLIVSSMGATDPRPAGRRLCRLPAGQSSGRRGVGGEWSRVHDRPAGRAH